MPLRKCSRPAEKRTSVSPYFLETKGLEDTSSAAAMSTYCLTAKRVCLYLARAAPQQSIDQLVYAISLRGLEVDYPPGGSGDAGDDGISGSGDFSNMSMVGGLLRTSTFYVILLFLLLALV